MFRWKKVIIKRAYKVSPKIVKKVIEHHIRRCEKGEYWSETLREIYNDIYGIKIGIGSYGCFKQHQFPRGTEIGNYCSIAQEVRYLNGNHPKNFVSTHPMFYHKSLGFVNEDRIQRNNLVVGNDVWIGWGAIIVSSCTEIADGAIVAAGSVVTKNVAPYTIVAGVPAHEIGKRFSDELIEKIRGIEWYNKGPEFLGEYIDCFQNPEKLIQAFNNSEEIANEV